METKCVFVFYPSPLAPINVLHAQMFEGGYVSPYCTTFRMARRKHLCDAHDVQAGFTQLGRDTVTARMSFPMILAWQTVSSAVALNVSSSSLTCLHQRERSHSRHWWQAPVLSLTCILLQASGDIDTQLCGYLCFRSS